MISAMEDSPVEGQENQFTQPESSSGGNSRATPLPMSNSRAATRPIFTTSSQREESLPSYGQDARSTANSQQQQGSLQSVILPEAVLDSFFSRIHGKPFYILDEPTTRHKHQYGLLPLHLAMAIHATTLRFTTCLSIESVSRSANAFADTLTLLKTQHHLCRWAWSMPCTQGMLWIATIRPSNPFRLFCCCRKSSLRMVWVKEHIWLYVRNM
jgi:hypothetical protein